ncbi:MAG: hypothetical protein VKL41_12670 [Snowella sp.]|nr:hypothetical protein [Snowella sp.]
MPLTRITFGFLTLAYSEGYLGGRTFSDRFLLNGKGRLHFQWTIINYQAIAL